MRAAEAPADAGLLADAVARLHPKPPPSSFCARARALAASPPNGRNGDVSRFADELEVAVMARPAELLVLDLRRNGGRDKRTYAPLLRAAIHATARGRRLAVLIGRATLSAAMQLDVDLAQPTPSVFIGEPTGGSPNHYGDAEPIPLPGKQVVARVAAIAWATAGAADKRLARDLDVSVPVESSAFRAATDPALNAALAS
jgi:hypothetical protein